MDHDGMHTIRSTLTSRIETLMLSIGEMQLSTLSEELDSIRALASRHKLRPVERLASLLGSVIAYNGHRQIAFNYLDLMRDAASCDDDRPDVAAAYLAAASLRGCRPYMGD